MISRPTIEELEDGSAYEKVLTLPYNDIAPFVIGRLKSFNLSMMAVWILLAIAAFLIIWFWPGVRYSQENPRIFFGLATGLTVLPVLLIPVHEGLHLITFRLSGAKDIRYGADLRQGIIYVTAHRFVADTRLFSAVAFTPFVVITACIGAAMIVSPPWWQWVLSLTLITHTTMCAGDTALIGFMRGFRQRNAYTWDDADRKEAYFYAKK
jgi:Putative zincin peptidase